MKPDESRLEAGPNAEHAFTSVSVAKNIAAVTPAATAITPTSIPIQRRAQSTSPTSSIRVGVRS